MSTSTEWCDKRHAGVDEEIMRIRGRLDGNGGVGLFSRVAALETQMKELISIPKVINRQTLIIIVLAVLSGGNLTIKALEILKVIP